jgi:serine/threonine protein kinase
MNPPHNTKSHSSLCPNCGIPLAGGSLSGLCPACLLKQGGLTDNLTDADARAFEVPTAVELGPYFPQLTLMELIGHGGMGAVYKARQKDLDRVAALKILPSALGDIPGFAERFSREAKALAKLNHPGIVMIHEFGQVDGLFYFLMEFVDGVNLSQLLAGGRISPREALAIVPQICDALQFAHDHGIVHRDIKPANILLDRQGRVKVVDFGIAKLVSGCEVPGTSPADEVTDDALTGAGKSMGTPNYMAPEQSDSPDEVDHRVDIYALGVVFYQMLTGELPQDRITPPRGRACWMCALMKLSCAPWRSSRISATSKPVLSKQRWRRFPMMSRPFRAPERHSRQAEKPARGKDFSQGSGSCSLALGRLPS